MKETTRRRIEAQLMDDPYADDWEEQHKKIQEWHQDDRGHVVCGCGVHQAWCAECSSIYEPEQ